MIVPSIYIIITSIGIRIYRLSVINRVFNTLSIGRSLVVSCGEEVIKTFLFLGAPSFIINNIDDWYTIRQYFRSII